MESVLLVLQGLKLMRLPLSRRLQCQRFYQMIHGCTKSTKPIRYKCATSAADFNQRLNHNRPVSFLDLHTNIEQVPRALQPKSVRVEVDVSFKENFLKVDGGVASDHNDKWKSVEGDDDDDSFPIALEKDQYSSLLPIYPIRFSQDSRSTVKILREGAELQRKIEIHDLPPTLLGAVPFTPLAKTSIRKRGRPRKDDGGGTCVHCNELECPGDEIVGVPKDFLLNCARCHSRQHPKCTEIQDRHMIEKCATINWLCPNCKVFYIFSNTVMRKMHGYRR